MSAHVDTLDRPEPLGKSFLGSVFLHVGVAAAIILLPMLPGGRVESWGSPKGGGGMGTVAVQMATIPLPSRSGPVNPVANDTESRVPAPPPAAKAQQKQAPPEPDAIPLKSRNAPRRWVPESTSTNKWRASQRDASNQMYSRSGQSLSSNMYGIAGSGEVGIGDGTPFGERLGNYAMILRQMVAQRWNTAELDPRLRTAPEVIVIFTLLRNGQVRNVRIAQRSGNPLLDTSAQRAIYDAAPFPPIPAEYTREEANIEFHFRLNR